MYPDMEMCRKMTDWAESGYQCRHTLIRIPALPVGSVTSCPVLDRLVHNAHRIEMREDSMRKNRGKPNP